jgi:N-acetylglucosamine-6-phosphate deacetylase
MIAITAAVLFTPLERIHQPIVLIEDGFVTAVHSRTTFASPSNARLIDFGDAILAPGFVDIHIHGAGGQDVMSLGGDSLSAMEDVLVRHGVSSYLPTTVTAPIDLTLSSLARLADVIERASPTGQNGHRARARGIHLEGPFLSHTRRGVHPSENLVRPSVAVFDRLWQAARGHIKVMTIAPELEGALEVISEASRRGVAVSLGHSDATLEQTRAAVAAGARHATHTFNAMRPLSHHDPGILGVVLTDTALSADIILDGIHVHPAMVELFVRMKGSEQTVLISDGLSATGMPEGHYRLGSFDIEVRGGRCLAGQTLAGSVLTLDQGVRNAMKFANLDFQEAVRTATLNPAKVGGISGQAGILAPGVPADIVVLHPQYEVIQTIVHGHGIEL